MTNGTGVIRPYTLTDVLATIAGQNSLGNQGTTALTTPLSAVGQVNEVATSAETVSTFVSTDLGWDQENLGAIQWA